MIEPFEPVPHHARMRRIQAIRQRLPSPFCRCGGTTWVEVGTTKNSWWRLWSLIMWSDFRKT